MIIDKINTDLKNAMLSGDKVLTDILRNLKSALLYEQVSQGTKGSEVNDDLIIKVFSKELKKRNDAIALYDKAGDKERADKERQEVTVISKYLPKSATEEEIKEAINQFVKNNNLDTSSPRAIGQIIGGVKANLPGPIDGGLLARLVKSYIEGNS